MARLCRTTRSATARARAVAGGANRAIPIPAASPTTVTGPSSVTARAGEVTVRLSP